ncbi:MAG TPA: hypothetical protein PLF32_01630 [Bacteroidales bacterium]|nr:hypothetical protein [Bacteroidales bacterium]HON20019.1 hypothetical protein [Bacteroidales bacterium]HOR81341.1 hypothetical protein [Bacteroidales bacterium]HPJ90819.1 hypothetical protein [Bacteroidales bacterium]
MINQKRNKIKLKNIIIEILMFAIAALLLKFRGFADGTMMTWRELLETLLFLIILMPIAIFRNYFLFSDKSDNNNKKNKNKNDKNDKKESEQ